MKTFKTLIILSIVLFVNHTKGQSNCSQYYPFKQGVSMEFTSYDKKDQVESTTRTNIINVENKGGATVATAHTVVTDMKKNEETLNTNYEMICNGDEVEIDMKSVIQHRLTSSLEKSNSSSQADVSGTNAIVPNNLEVGSSLPNSEVDMDVTSGSMNLNFYVKTENRKVVGMESVTVPAGTFDCVVIAYDVETKMLIKKHTKSKMWLAEGVGLVKQEDYNKKGDLIKKEVLTSFSE